MNTETKELEAPLTYQDHVSLAVSIAVILDREPEVVTILAHLKKKPENLCAYLQTNRPTETAAIARASRLVREKMAKQLQT